ncbi:MAG: DUF11 domain-containing protein, partial [Bacteroidetes bacterium]|nr:DUF11 domain-containing protein [Bacteroidota bacterium]
MHNFIKHIATFLLLSGVMVALGQHVHAQTPAGTRIDNIATARFQLQGGTPDTVKSDPASIVVEGWGVLSLNKTASRDSAHARDTVQFTIVAGYVGNLGASQVVVTDTVPSQFTVIGVSRGTFTGNIVTWNAGRITAAAPDSIVITAVVASGDVGITSVMNIATAVDSLGIVTRDSAAVVLHIDLTESCVIAIESSSKRIIGNGQQWARILAKITDSLGVPKPDGTPVLFRTDKGTFSNGKDTVTHFTLNGTAVDSLNADITSSTFVEATVTVQLLSLCNTADSITVLFYPGAITGVVLDNVTKKFYENAYIRLIDSTTSVLIDADTTQADGRFLMFVPKTGTYRVDVSASDKFSLENTVTTYVPVDITGTTTHIIPNKNAISGTVYYWFNNRPIYIPNMPIELFEIKISDDGAKGRIDADATIATLRTVTDSRGVYEFVNVQPGMYKVLLGDSELNGRATITIPENGYYVLNGNIPVELTVSPTIVKEGTAAAFLGDTATYTITARNPNEFKLTDAKIIDSLHVDMQFVSASGNGTYNPASHSITWNLGQIDSSYRGSVSASVRVSSSTPLPSLLNRATLTANEMPALTDSVTTLVKRQAALGIVKTVNKDSAAIGDTMQYRIVVKNTGAAALPNVVMTDTLDASKMTILLVSSNAVQDNNIVTAQVDTLQPGDSLVVTVRVRVTDSAAPAYQNTAHAVSALTTIRTASAATPWSQNIQPNVAVLHLTKSVSRDTV